VSFWQCYYHVIWTTKNRQPMIQPHYETALFSVIADKTQRLECALIAINGISDHIHAAVAIPPGMSVAQWVGQVKGVSSHLLNAQFVPTPRFEWQESYGVMTFGQRNTDQVTAYIKQQKEHHANNTLNSWLERIDD
jgi:putative transposase